MGCLLLMFGEVKGTKLRFVRDDAHNGTPMEEGKSNDSILNKYGVNLGNGTDIGTILCGCEKL